MKKISEYTDEDFIKQLSMPGLVEQCAARLDGGNMRKRAMEIDDDDHAAREALQSIMEAE